MRTMKTLMKVNFIQNYSFKETIQKSFFFLDDEDFEDDESNDKSVYSKNSKTKKRNSKKEIDTDNDYEIKHNCLTEDGAYMNTLFNSPSSISSSSNVDMRSKTIHLM